MLTQQLSREELHRLADLIGQPRNLAPPFNIAPTTQTEVSPPMERTWPDYTDTSQNPRWRWRRTAIGGEVSPDDWCFYDGDGRPAARIRKEDGGPLDGRWNWSVQVGPDGRPRNGGTGYCDSGKEARETCEWYVPGAVEARAKWETRA